MKNTKILMALAFAATTVASAATNQVQGTVNITASVKAVCSISSGPSNLVFPQYDVFSTSGVSASSTFGVRCTKGTPYTVTLVAGPAGGRTFTSGPSTNFAYALTMTTVSTTSASNAEVPYTVNGSISAGQDVAQGDYSGTATVTVDY